MNKEIWDLVIVGGGPAGMAAGIYGARSKLKTIILEKGRVGGQATTTEGLENYPGFGRGAKGPALMDSIRKHAEDFGVVFERGQVTDFELDGEIKVIRTKKGQEYYAKAVVLAPGANPRTLGIKGEKAFVGNGVGYCATCDAEFYQNLDVVVVGNGDSAIEEAIYLTKFAQKVTIIVIHDEGILDANKVSQEKAYANPKINFVWNSVLDEIKGDEYVEKVVVKNLKTDELSEIETSGVFIFVGYVPNTEFLKGKVELDDNGYIIVNGKMETSIPGVYAAGDANQKFLRQVVTATSDGAIAAVAADKYLAEEENFKMQVLDAKESVIVIFWTPQNTESIAAVSAIEQSKEKYPDTKLVKIDLYKNNLIASKYSVEQAPAVLLFNKGEYVGRIDGNFDYTDIDTLIAKL